MLSALRQLFTPPPSPAARETYIALVNASRNPFFFTTLGVPDTLDGRFELIVLHLFLLQHRLREASPDFARELSELFFTDMDHSVREIGVSDTGVRYRIKAMGKAYHGRLQAYGAGMGDGQLLRSALARNLYGTVEIGDVGHLNRMAQYMEQTNAALAQADAASITNGTFSWPTPAA